jgi:hypothetical protein
MSPLGTTNGAIRLPLLFSLQYYFVSKLVTPLNYLYFLVWQGRSIHINKCLKSDT